MTVRRTCGARARGRSVLPLRVCDTFQDWVRRRRLPGRASRPPAGKRASRRGVGGATAQKRLVVGARNLTCPPRQDLDWPPLSPLGASTSGPSAGWASPGHRLPQRGCSPVRAYPRQVPVAIASVRQKTPCFPGFGSLWGGARLAGREPCGGCEGGFGVPRRNRCLAGHGGASRLLRGRRGLGFGAVGADQAARRRWRIRSSACSIRPRRCRLAASTERATVRSKPSAPQLRTRSRPRCSRPLMADSTAGCARRAAAKASSFSRSRSARDRYPFFGRTLRSRIWSSRMRFSELWKPRVEAARPQVREPLLGRPHQRHCRIDVLAVPQHLVVKDEPILVLDQRHRDSELHRRARLALRDPSRVRLEDREDLLLMRNRLAQKQSALDLVHLTPSMSDEALDRFTGGFTVGDDRKVSQSAI